MVKSRNSRIDLAFDFSPHGENGKADLSVSTLGDSIAQHKPDVVMLESSFETKEKARRAEDNYAELFKIQSNADAAGLAHEVIVPASHPFKYLLVNRVPYVFVLERASSPTDGTKFRTFDGQNANDYIGSLVSHFHSGRYSKVIDGHRYFTEKRFAGLAHRNNGMYKVLSNLHSQLIARHPELKSKPSIKVLVRFGRSHTDLYNHALKQGFASVTRNVKPVVFSSEDARLRKSLSTGTYQAPSELQCAREFLEKYLTHVMKPNEAIQEHEEHNIINASRLIARKISLAQFHEISRELSENIYPQMREQALRAAFSKRGIRIPASHQEVNQLLEQNDVRVFKPVV